MVGHHTSSACRSRRWRRRRLEWEPDSTTANTLLPSQCASGSGQFLENTARLLGVSQAEIGQHAAELLFRHKVLRLLQNAGLFTEERTELLLSWRYTGFSVHTRVRVEPEDQGAVGRLARYLLRPPVSLERMSWDGGGEVRVVAFILDHDVVAAILRHLERTGRHPELGSVHGQTLPAVASWSGREANRRRSPAFCVSTRRLTPVHSDG